MGYCFRHSFMIFVLLMSPAHDTLGCFPVEDVFKTSCQWMQPNTIQSRYRLDVCAAGTGAKRGTRMSVTAEGTDESDKALECLEAYNEHRYLVKVHNSETLLGYQCIKLSPLTDKVVRQGKSPVVVNKSELSCLSTDYSADQSLLQASFNFTSMPCPVTGGYQLLMHLPNSSSSTHTAPDACLSSAPTYKPHLQFQCDQAGSANVVADLGTACTSQNLRDSEMMRGRQTAHLQCVDSWQEKEHHSNRPSTTVLMRLRDFPEAFWCLHLRRAARPSHTVLTSEEVLYEALLAFDGRCVENIPNPGTVSTGPGTMMGRLAAFVPDSNIKCRDNSYLQSCDADAGNSKCVESTECPQSCGRCQRDLTLINCSFPTEFRAIWESDTERLVVGEDTVRKSAGGVFQCRGPEEKGEAGGIYALVQTGAVNTCLPNYACAQMDILAKGVLSYRQFPALRDSVTGEVMSCQKSLSMGGSFNRPPAAERTVTLLQRNGLTQQGATCDFMATMSYSTVGLEAGCQLVVHECSGPCQVFNTSLNAGTCGNKTADDAGLVTEHTCLASIPLGDSVRAVLTQSESVYLCWVFLSSRLFIVPAEDCNQRRVNAILSGASAVVDFDPIRQLTRRPVADKKPNGGRAVLIVSFSTAVLLLVALCLTVAIF